jgi:hypothetical protein
MTISVRYEHINDLKFLKDWSQDCQALYIGIYRLAERI